MRELMHLTGRAPDRKKRSGANRIDARAETATHGSSGPDAARPVLLAVDADADARGRIERELCKRYGGDYRVVAEGSTKAAMARLREFEAAGEDVAVVLADQWMPGMSGTDFLARVRHLFPTATRALLISQGDTTIREAVLRATALGGIDYYVNKPTISPDEQFHRVISEFLDEWAKVHRPGFVAVRIVGRPWSPRSHELRDLWSRSGFSRESDERSSSSRRVAA